MFLVNKHFFRNYDMDATTFKYGRIGGPQGYPIPGKNGVETSGASTTVTATDGTPFDPVNVGDIITFLTIDAKTIRRVATKTSGAEITVDSSITLAEGTAFIFEPFLVSADDADCWHHVQDLTNITVYLDGATIAAGGGVDWEIQTLGYDHASLLPFTVQSSTLAASGAQTSYSLPQVAGKVRVGLKGGSDFTGTDVVSAWLTGEQRLAK